MEHTLKKPARSPSVIGRLNKAFKDLGRSRRKFLQGSGPEALHDFRVSLRRIRTLLGLMKSCIPAGTIKDPLDGLKEIARQTNALRDQEVLCATLASLPILKGPSLDLERWVNSQEDLRRGLELEIREYLGSPSVARRMENLPRALGKPKIPGGEAGMRREIHRRFKKERRRLGKALKNTAGENPSVRNLHRLRVGAKKVRYTLEELGFLMPNRRRKIAGLCRKLQDRLGAWRDWDKALSLLKKERTRFPEAKPWRVELGRRKAEAWKGCRKAAKNLRRALP